MNAAFRHARAQLLLLWPPRSAALRVACALASSGLALAFAGRFLFAAELGERLFGALWVLLATVGLTALRLGSAGRASGEPPFLPIGRFARALADLALYLALSGGFGALLALGAAAIGLRVHELRLLDQAVPGPGLALARYGAAALLLLPLLIASLPGAPQRGPLALLRLLLPWLPLGIAAPAGWLATPGGLLGTTAAMGGATALVFALRRAGSEDWRPVLPARACAHAREGLPGRRRLARDLRAGLARGALRGVLLSLAGLPLALCPGRGWLVDCARVAGVLLIAAAGLLSPWAALHLPIGGRMGGWRAPALPWALLPLPHGAFLGALQAHQALSWALLLAVQGLALAFGHTVVGYDTAQRMVLDFSVSMLVALMPPLFAWELLNARARGAPGWPMAAFLWALGLATGQLPLLGGIAAAEFFGGAATLSWTEACLRQLWALGPAALGGLAWLAAGRLLVLREFSPPARVGPARDR